tara:strand:- start:418 stop:738 length:321 start_codon:yes stop_codon:yes gene_type:complete
MEFKGTNCEWKVNPNIDKNDFGVKFLSIDFIGISHIDCINVYANKNQDEINLKANAQLIASAPELLEALKTLIDPFTGLCYDSLRNVTNNEVLSKIEKAIEKATKI